MCWVLRISYVIVTKQVTSSESYNVTGFFLSIDRIHHSRHIGFHIIMLIKYVISEGANELKSANFNYFTIISDAFYVAMLCF